MRNIASTVIQLNVKDTYFLISHCPIDRTLSMSQGDKEILTITESDLRKIFEFAYKLKEVEEYVG